MFITYDWDANQYFRNLFSAGSSNVHFNMKYTMHNLLIGGRVQEDSNYVNDYSKKVEYIKLCKTQLNVESP